MAPNKLQQQKLKRDEASLEEKEDQPDAGKKAKLDNGTANTKDDGSEIEIIEDSQPERKPSASSSVEEKENTAPPARKEESNKDERKKTSNSESKSEQEEVESSKTQEEAEVRKRGTLEEGHIYFLYRPKVELEEAHNLDEVARFQILLLPEKGSPKYRFLTVGRKQLPENTGGGGRQQVVWGDVIAIGDDMKEIKDRVGEETYSTKTKGERHLAPMRVAGSGIYAIHCPELEENDAPEGSKNMTAVWDTFLAYVLSLPQELGDVQKELHIHKEGAFHIQVKDPAAKSSNPRVGTTPEERRPPYPSNLSKLLTTRFTALNPVDFLNYTNSELLFIPSKEDLEDDLGKEGAKLEKEAEKEAQDDDVGKVLKKLGTKDVEVGPLEGRWE